MSVRCARIPSAGAAHGAIVGVCVCVCLCLCVCAQTHMCVAKKQRVRGHASACGAMLIERVQLAVCCTNFSSACCGVVGGGLRWMCDRVI